MAKFDIQVGRDARVYYSATIEAVSLEAAKKKLSRHGYDVPDSVVWIQEGFDDFENIETCNISNVGEDEVLARYTDENGWEA